MQWFYRLLIVGGLLAFASRSGAAAENGIPQNLPEADRTDISDAAQDDTGKIWGYVYFTEGPLKSWTGEAWKNEKFVPSAGVVATRITRVEDGAVLCLWEPRNSGGACYITEHRGSSNKVLVKFRPKFEYLNALTRTRLGVILTVRGTEIYGIRDGTLQQIHHVDWPDTPAGKEPKVTNGVPFVPHVPMSIAEDGAGNTWFYPNDFSARGSFDAGIRGLLKWDGKTWTHYRIPKGLPDENYLTVVKRDADSFWVGTRDKGLYVLDCRTVTARHVAEPEPGAFGKILCVRQLNDQTYVLAFSNDETTYSYDTSQRMGTLWRLTSAKFPARDKSKLRGGWEIEIRGVDRGREYWGSGNREMVADGDEVWVSTRNDGVWRLKSGCEPLLVNWRQGFNLTFCRAFLVQRDGRLVFVSSKTMGDVRAFARMPGVAQPTAFRTHGLANSDDEHHVWVMSSLESREMREWDGDKWLHYRLPADYEMRPFYYSSMDRLGRVWLMPKNETAQVPILNPKNGSWVTYRNFKTALTSELARWGPTKFSGLDIGEGYWLHVHFQEPNRIAYRAANNTAEFFDGKNWKSWTAAQIQNVQSAYWPECEGIYFNALGQLTADFKGSVYSWTEKGGWERDPNAQSKPVQPDPKPPEWSGITKANSTTKDRLGATWMTQDGQLYKAAFGLCRPQFTPEERNPLRDGRELQWVGIDPRGHRIIQTGEDWSSEYYFLPTRTAPQTSARLQLVNDDVLVVKMFTPVKGQRWFRWRLDGKDWSKSQTAGEVRVEAVPSGFHVFEAAAIDQWLEIDPSPVRIEFDVKIDPDAQISKYMEMLESEDLLEREKAVAALARQGERALPRLHAVRKRRDERERWWIDAAIQAAENVMNPQPEVVPGQDGGDE